MKVDGQIRRTIWPDDAGRAVHVIDQRWLPHRLDIATLVDLDTVVTAIREMWVRGAPLIGVTAAYGLALHLQRDASDVSLARAASMLVEARPTAVNLAWAVRRIETALSTVPAGDRAALGWRLAGELADEDVALNAPSAPPACRCSSAIADRKCPARASTSSRTATPAGSPPSTGDRHRADLRRARRRPAHARVGRRDAPAQPGRQPHRVGTPASTACRTPSSPTTPAAT
jgi:hypothetical protein